MTNLEMSLKIPLSQWETTLKKVGEFVFLYFHSSTYQGENHHILDFSWEGKEKTKP